MDLAFQGRRFISFILPPGYQALATLHLRERHVYDQAAMHAGGAAGSNSIATEHPPRETQLANTADDAGKLQQGFFTLIGSSDDFRIGQEIVIVMPRFGTGPSVPASLFLYMQRNVQWLSFTVAGRMCLVAAVVCLSLRARIPAHLPK